MLPHEPVAVDASSSSSCGTRPASAGRSSARPALTAYLSGRVGLVLCSHSMIARRSAPKCLRVSHGTPVSIPTTYKAISLRRLFPDVAQWRSCLRMPVYRPDRYRTGRIRRHWNPAPILSRGTLLVSCRRVPHNDLLCGIQYFSPFGSRKSQMPLGNLGSGDRRDLGNGNSPHRFVVKARVTEQGLGCGKLRRWKGVGGPPSRPYSPIELGIY